jgi:hypothetical protein
MPDGRILAGGSVSNSYGDHSIARFLPDGSFDPFFGTGGKNIADLRGFNDSISSLALTSTGTIVAGGRSGTTYMNDNIDFAVVRYTAGATPAPDLFSVSDTGASNTDNVTNVATPSFAIATTGPYFQVLRNGSVTGGAYLSGSSVTLPTQPDGTWDYAIAAVDAAGNVGVASTPLSVTIDTTGPQISSWQSAAVHARGVGEVGLTIADTGTFVEGRVGGVSTLLLTLGEAIDASSLASFTVGLWGNGSDNLPLNLSGIGITTEIRSGGTNPFIAINFAGGLPDFARYLVRVAGLRDLAGNLLSGDTDRIFTVLVGDVTGDRRANNTDVGAVQSLRGLDPISALDINAVRSDVTRDGRINNTDVGGVLSTRGKDGRFIPDPIPES